MDPEALVRDYLGRLEAAASPLPADRRAELVGEVRGHIELALAEAQRTDEATVRNVLERLGSPDEIVAAEAVPDTPTPGASTASTGTVVASSPSVAVETIALVLLTVGALVLPFVGPLLGLVFVWASARWTTVQKRTATMIVIVLLVLPVVILVPMAASGEITAIFSTFGPLVLLVPLAGIVAAIYLLAAIYLEVTLVLRRR
jgi:hypothetical protein